MNKRNLILHSPPLQWLLAIAYPQLREWPVREWQAKLAEARKIDFDNLEQAGTLAGVVIVAMLVKPAGAASGGAIVAYLAQFVTLVPLLALVLAPFFIRRCRRGLAALAERSRLERTIP